MRQLKGDKVRQRTSSKITVSHCEPWSDEQIAEAAKRTIALAASYSKGTNMKVLESAIPERGVGLAAISNDTIKEAVEYLVAGNAAVMLEVEDDFQASTKAELNTVRTYISNYIRKEFKLKAATRQVLAKDKETPIGLKLSVYPLTETAA